jgi:phytoene dehydrogenase-like protein
MGALTGAMADAARSRGVEIRTNAAVERLLISEDGVQGVVLEGGEEIRARVVVSNADPKRTFLEWVEPRSLEPDFLQAIRNYRCEGTSLKINLALDGLPDFKNAPGRGPHHGATIHICPTIEYMERAWDDAKYGKPSRSPIIEMTLPTFYDPSLAPAGKHIMGVFVQYAPYTLAESSWDELRESYADRVIDCIAEYAPNLRSIILDRQVLTPLDIERRFGMSGGNIFHGAMSLDQLFLARPVLGFARYRTPIRNLYLCGSGTHPGGGVIGACGHNAARCVLRDWQR